MKKTIIPITAVLIATTVLLLGMWSYYSRVVNEIEQQGSNAAVYDRHYVVVSEDSSELWQSIYESAREAAARENVYLEWIGANSPANYTLKDSMKVAIASKVDGIILYPWGGLDVTEQINEAAKQGIPVVTVLNDCNESDRISFVGINSHQMGQIYGEQILNLLEDGMNRVLVLVNTSMEDVNTNLMYSQMNAVVEAGKPRTKKVEISAYSVDSTANFEAEEVIRDIFINSDSLPDILICLDPVSTECAYQAIVDYNEVGNVNIVGYYTSDIVMNAIHKGLIPAAVTIDTGEIGRYSIDALNEYLSAGHVSNYFNVGLSIVTKDETR